MLRKPRGQRGVTLIELMIASLLALIALAAILAAHSVTARHSSDYLRQAHLHQQLHGLLHLMASDLRRAGYWHFSPQHQAASDNPFLNGDSALRLGAFAGETADSCILFAYDLDRDGLVGIGRCPPGGCSAGTDADNVEQFGFRLREARVQARYGGTAADCAEGYWQSVTDPDIEISALRFTHHTTCSGVSGPEAPCRSNESRLIRQAVEIVLVGHAHSAPDTPLALSRWVSIRNDRLLGAER